MEIQSTLFCDSNKYKKKGLVVEKLNYNKFEKLENHFKF